MDAPDRPNQSLIVGDLEFYLSTPTRRTKKLKSESRESRERMNKPKYNISPDLPTVESERIALHSSPH
jgi:hypothetical protein